MDMIERAARALGGYYEGDADPIDTPNNYARAVGGVRAVLEALREPDEGMLVEGSSWTDTDTDTAKDFWQAMIDKALRG